MCFRLILTLFLISIYILMLSQQNQTAGMYSYNLLTKTGSHARLGQKDASLSTA
jgi:hypothetical protein